MKSPQDQIEQNKQNENIDAGWVNIESSHVGKLIIPDEKPPYVSQSDELYKETFIAMRYQLKNDLVFMENLNILFTILKNIVNDPKNKKFQKLRLSNDKIKKAIQQCE